MFDLIWVVIFIQVITIMGLGATLEKIHRELNELKAK